MLNNKVQLFSESSVPKEMRPGKGRPKGERSCECPFSIQCYGTGTIGAKANSLLALCANYGEDLVGTNAQGTLEARAVVQHTTSGLSYIGVQKTADVVSGEAIFNKSCPYKYNCMSPARAINQLRLAMESVVRLEAMYFEEYGIVINQGASSPLGLVASMLFMLGDVDYQAQALTDFRERIRAYRCTGNLNHEIVRKFRSSF